MQKSAQYFFPYELIEANWRLWSFILILAVGSYALIAYPVAALNGYIDPFYSPTVLIVPIPGLFRLTCYAYRKDYHRHLLHHPLACDNPERDDKSSRHYTGERNAVFLIENLHRYFLYAGILILPFFYYDFYRSLIFADSLRFGSLLILANALALTAWTLSCHAFRHLVGGNIDCYSCAKAGGVRNSLWRAQSWWNSRHEALAWISLATIVIVDLYLRGLAAGLPLDFKL
ncbi:MAG: hypothetical protein ACHQ1H_07065, partial [Nitrososphaerales archaeon]